MKTFLLIDERQVVLPAQAAMLVEYERVDLNAPVRGSMSFFNTMVFGAVMLLRRNARIILAEEMPSIEAALVSLNTPYGRLSDRGIIEDIDEDVSIIHSRAEDVGLVATIEEGV
jgi:hypothetical protein